jgi:hypothetical protein
MTSPGACPLRAVVLRYPDSCFLDTDGVTRDAARMLELMGRWRPQCSDREVGVRRNGAFNPDLHVVVSEDRRIRYPHGAEPPGERGLLFTIVPRDER